MAWLTTTRKVLLSIMVIGATGSAVGAGTYASFNATTSNAAEVATGTLVLENVKDDGTDAILGTACLSTGGSDTDDNHQAGCQALMNVEVQRPGDVAFADLTVSNLGNLAGTLRLHASQACTTTSAGGSFNGGGNACDGTRLTIQQYAGTTERDNGDTTGGTCWYGGGAGGSTCSFDASAALTDFVADHPATGLAPLDMGAIAADGERILRVSVELPENSANALQGVQANFGFTWVLVQQT